MKKDAPTRDFELGIERAVEGLLVSPEFLYRIEREPAGTAIESDLSDQRSRAGLAAVVLPVEQHPRRLRCSTLRASGKLRNPGVLEQQVRRMLADPRADALVTQFRRAVAVPAKSSDGAARSRNAIPTSTKTCGRASGAKRSSLPAAFCGKIASVLELLTANYTFVNERLAKHYGIPQHPRHTFPPRRACRRQPPRASGPRQRAGGHVVPASHVAGVARQVDTRESARHDPCRRRRRTCRRSKEKPNPAEESLSMRAAHRAASGESRRARAATR